MTDAASFSGTGDSPAPTTTPQQGFQDQGTPDTGAVPEVTPEQLAEILKRDEHAQRHIQQLEQEAKERKAQLDQLSESLAELEKDRMSQKTLEELLAQRAGQDDTKSETTQIDVADLAKQVEAQLAERQQAEAAKANLASAMEAARAAYGDKFLDEVSTRAKEIGMSLEEVDSLASRSPAAFSRLFVGTGTTEAPAGKVPPTPGTQSHAVFREQEAASLAADTREVYRKDPRSYFSPEMYERTKARLQASK